MANKQLWILCGAVIGLTSLSIASGAVPSSGSQPLRVTDDTAIYQRLSEIKVPRETRPNFDADIERLSNLEARYRERLPSIERGARLNSPMKRISAQQYRYSGRTAAKPVVKN